MISVLLSSVDNLAARSEALRNATSGLKWQWYVRARKQYIPHVHTLMLREGESPDTLPLGGHRPIPGEKVSPERHSDLTLW